MEAMRQSLLNVIRQLANENNQLRQDCAREQQDSAHLRQRLEETERELIRLREQNVELEQLLLQVKT